MTAPDRTRQVVGAAAAAPRRRRWGRRLAVGGALLGAAVCAVLVYLLVWGPLLPYSPIVTGFEKTESSHAVLYVESGASNEIEAAFAACPAAQDLAWVDGLVAEVEASHTLTFKSRPRLFFFTDRDTYLRRTSTKARACTYYNGSIVVSPWVQQEDADGVLSLEVYLRHELSHALLYQYMGMLTARRYPKWLLEGIATWSAGQMGTFAYPSAEETYALVAAGEWMPPEVYRTPGEDDVPLEVDDRMTFMYCEFACIVDDLVARYGRETFFAYVTALMDEGDHDAVFREAFGTGFDAYLAGFRSRVADAADLGRVE